VTCTYADTSLYDFLLQLTTTYRLVFNIK